MARLYPHGPGSDAPESERLVFDALAKLPDNWRVFHSVVWQSRRGRRQGDGEADFIILSPEHGALVLEVKGGDIEVFNGIWSSTNRYGQRFEITNPFEQAMKSKYALRQYLEALDPPILRVPISHAVAFPHGSVGQGIGMYGPRDLVLDKADLTNVTEAVERVFRHWEVVAALPKKQIDRIAALLAPTTAVRSRLRDEVAGVEAGLIRLTDQQVGALQGLKRWRHAAVVGGPGTGKTILALERVRELVQDGFSPMITCFNAPLGAAIEKEVGTLPGVLAGSFHKLCFSLAYRAHLALPSNPSDEWWRTGAPELLLEAGGILGSAFGALVIDEAQDFEGSWIEALLMLLDDPDQAPVYIFADPQQAIYRDSWSLPQGWPPPYELSINCRSSLPIARAVAAVFAYEALSLGTEGPIPLWVSAGDETTAVLAVQDIVDRLLTNELLDGRQVTVLCDARSAVDRLRMRSVSTAMFVEPSRAGVAVETIHRFKGLESEVVVLCLTTCEDTPEWKYLAYVGMSRARSMLVVVGSPLSRLLVAWPG